MPKNISHKWQNHRSVRAPALLRFAQTDAQAVIKASISVVVVQDFADFGCDECKGCYLRIAAVANGCQTVRGHFQHLKLSACFKAEANVLSWLTPYFA